MKLRYPEAFYSRARRRKVCRSNQCIFTYIWLQLRYCMNFGVDTKKDLEQHKEGNRYNAEVKALLDAGVHKTTEKFEDLSIIPQAVIHMQVFIQNPKHQ